MGKRRVLDARPEANQPIRKLDFIIMAGTKGKFAMLAGDARIVRKRPPTIQPKETIVAVSGPLSAKSRSAALFGGKDFNGVMHPNNPNCGDGSGTGNPILILLIFATR